MITPFFTCELLLTVAQVFTRTQWYIVPLIWLPISLNLLVRSLVGFSQPIPHFVTAPLLPFTSPYIASITSDAIAYTTLCFILGNFIWTLLEYTLHRFLFHIDDLLPDKPVFLMLHFLMHGIHHYLPMDRWVCHRVEIYLSIWITNNFHFVVFVWSCHPFFSPYSPSHSRVSRTFFSPHLWQMVLSQVPLHFVRTITPLQLYPNLLKRIF